MRNRCSFLFLIFCSWIHTLKACFLCSQRVGQQFALNSVMYTHYIPKDMGAELYGNAVTLGFHCRQVGLFRVTICVTKQVAGGTSTHLPGQSEKMMSHSLPDRHESVPSRTLTLFPNIVRMTSS